MKQHYNRRKFIKTTAASGLGILLSESLPSLAQPMSIKTPVRIGIIGLDTEHSVAFTRVFNDANPADDVSGLRVIAAYPYGSRDIASSAKVIPAFTAEIKELGVEIVDSIDQLLVKVDAVLLETNDGRLHLEQAIPVIKAGKMLFIDKPMAASLADVLMIFKMAEKHGVPVFTASSLRYMKSVQQILSGNIGRVLGADTYSPAIIEQTHPDLFWYGIHGVEALFTVMGTGCKQVSRIYTDGTDLVTGVWDEQRIGTFRGIRAGATGFGGTAYGDKGIVTIGPWESYRPLVVEIAKFFRTGKMPVSFKETVEIFAFMEAADISKQNGGISVNISDVIQKTRLSVK